MVLRARTPAGPTRFLDSGREAEALVSGILEASCRIRGGASRQGSMEQLVDHEGRHRRMDQEQWRTMAHHRVLNLSVSYSFESSPPPKKKDLKRISKTQRKTQQTILNYHAFSPFSSQLFTRLKRVKGAPRRGSPPAAPWPSPPPPRRGGRWRWPRSSGDADPTPPCRVRTPDWSRGDRGKARRPGL